MSMNEFTKDELNDLNRDLTGLGGLLYGLSDSVDRSGIINEGSLMLLAEIAFRSAEVVKNIVHHRDNTVVDERREEILKVYDKLTLRDQVKLAVYAIELEEKMLEQDT
ncbi:MAG: hypothetical protein K2J80_13085 [Oscillospiraceae bacterium]|nr:hypothetical protein [Oscillospiraceae bacterium]